VGPDPRHQRVLWRAWHRDPIPPARGSYGFRV